MKLTGEEVQRVALLARLKLTPEEATQLTRQLDSILTYMNKLAELDIAEIEPFSHTQESADALREDVVTNRANAEAVLANATDRDDAFFKVPKIIE